MTKGQKLAAAIAHLQKADALIQSVFTGSDDLYEIYQMIGRVVVEVKDFAEDEGIDIPAEK